MPARPTTRLVPALTAFLLLALVLGATPARAELGTTSLERRNTNPTGTNAGSPANGVGGLGLSLASLPDGRIKVTWKRPGPVKRLKHYVLMVGPSRRLDRDVRTYKIKRKKTSIVVGRAVDAVPTSGNYSFVRITAVRKKGTKGGSPTKWIQAPLTAPCTALPQDRVTVGTFNVRTWKGDTTDKPKGLGWNLRGPNVIKDIRRSGARVVALQEASGKEGMGNGSVRQHQWIIDRLNEADASAAWVDGVDNSYYGVLGGLTGTRIIYDANVYTELAQGLSRVTDPKAPMDSLMPWVRLQATSGTQASFVVTSNHLRVGETRGDFDIRGRQTAKTVGFLKSLRKAFPTDQIVVAGDLNSTANTMPFNNVQRALLNAGLYDTYATSALKGAHMPTSNLYKFPLGPSPHRRDYILTYGGPRGSCGYTNLYFTAKSQTSSDHFMQVASVPLRHL